MLNRNGIVCTPRKKSVSKTHRESERERENSTLTIANTLFRISGPYQLFTLNAHTHTRTHRQTMETTTTTTTIHFLTLFTQSNTIVQYKWNDKYKYTKPKTAIRYSASLSLFLPRCGVMCDLHEMMAKRYSYTKHTCSFLSNSIYWVIWNFQ